MFMLCIGVVVCGQVVKAQMDTSFNLRQHDVLLMYFEELIEEDEANLEALEELLLEEEENRQVWMIRRQSRET